MSVPPPVMVPPVQSVKPVTVSEGKPVSVPPLMVSVGMVKDWPVARLSVPPEMVRTSPSSVIVPVRLAVPPETTVPAAAP